MSDRHKPHLTGLPGYHQGASWKVHACVSGVLMAGGLLLLWYGALIGATVTVLLSLPAAFLAGYCFRQQVLNTSRPARLGVFQLLEDLRGGGDPHGPTLPSRDPARHEEDPGSIESG